MEMSGPPRSKSAKPTNRNPIAKARGFAQEFNVLNGFEEHGDGFRPITLYPEDKYEGKILKVTDNGGVYIPTDHITVSLAKDPKLDVKVNEKKIRKYLKKHFDLSDEELNAIVLDKEKSQKIKDKLCMQASLETTWKAFNGFKDPETEEWVLNCSSSLFFIDPVDKKSTNEPLHLDQVRRFVTAMDPKSTKPAPEFVRNNSFLKEWVNMFKPILERAEALWEYKQDMWPTTELNIFLQHCYLCAGRMETSSGEFAFLPPMFVLNLDVSSCDTTNKRIFPFFHHMNDFKGMHFTFIANPSDHIVMAKDVRIIGKNADREMMENIVKSFKKEFTDMYKTILMSVSEVNFNEDDVMGCGSLTVFGMVPHHRSLPVGNNAKGFVQWVMLYSGAFSGELNDKALFVNSWAALARKKRAPRKKKEEDGEESGDEEEVDASEGPKEKKKAPRKKKASKDADSTTTTITETLRCQAFLKGARAEAKQTVKLSKEEPKPAKISKAVRKEAKKAVYRARVHLNLKHMEKYLESHVTPDMVAAVGAEDCARICDETIAKFQWSLELCNERHAAQKDDVRKNKELELQMEEQADRVFEVEWLDYLLAKDNGDDVEPPERAIISVADHREFKEIEYIPKARELFRKHRDQAMATLFSEMRRCELLQKNDTEKLTKKEIQFEVNKTYAIHLGIWNQKSREELEKINLKELTQQKKKAKKHIAQLKRYMELAGEEEVEKPKKKKRAPKRARVEEKDDAMEVEKDEPVPEKAAGEPAAPVAAGPSALSAFVAAARKETLEQRQLLESKIEEDARKQHGEADGQVEVGRRQNLADYDTGVGRADGDDDDDDKEPHFAENTEVGHGNDQDDIDDMLEEGHENDDDEETDKEEEEEEDPRHGHPIGGGSRSGGFSWGLRRQATSAFRSEEDREGGMRYITLDIDDPCDGTGDMEKEESQEGQGHDYAWNAVSRPASFVEETRGPGPAAPPPPLSRD